MSHVDEGQLHAYLDGELSPAEAGGVDAHLAQCPDCRRRLEEERALIARAAELLSLAAPPDRELPPFRAGEVKSPARLWWLVRLPLAWAATVVLALGIGRYVGSRSAARADRPVADAIATAPRGELSQRASKPQPPAHPTSRGAAPAPVPGALAKREAASNVSVPAPSGANRIADAVAALPHADTVAAPAALAEQAGAPAKSIERKAWQEERDAWQMGTAVTIDSARRVLGSDPLAVPGVPIEAVYLGRRIGYSGVVIVEQALDSTTTIRVINARSAPPLLEQVVVTGQAAAPREPPFPADSPAPRAKRPTPMAAKPVAQVRLDLFRDVRGPLSPDSLAVLRRRLQPLRAATGP